MPLTAYQREVARALAANRSEDSHLAGAAALHLPPNGTRYSNDLDFFHDSEQRVASAFSDDRATLLGLGHRVAIEMNQPGYIRAVVTRGADTTKVEWAHDSAWRFMPAQRDDEVGYRLHDVDLAINKVLALAGRDEPRDFLDIMFVHENILPLGALCWAAAGKDPGFTPLSLLELLRRRGKYRPEDFSRLRLVKPVDLHKLKQQWLDMLRDADVLIRALPPDELGCLYYSVPRKTFVAPVAGAERTEIIPHYGRPAGILPTVGRT